MTLSELSTKTLDEAKRHLEKMQWQMDEDTFLLADTLAPPTWIARVRKTHLSARGRAEQQFYVLGRGMEHFTLEEYTLPVLAAYAQSQKEKESNS